MTLGRPCSTNSPLINDMQPDCEHVIRRYAYRIGPTPSRERGFPDAVAWPSRQSVRRLVQPDRLRSPDRNTHRIGVRRWWAVHGADANTVYGFLFSRAVKGVRFQRVRFPPGSSRSRRQQSERRCHPGHDRRVVEPFCACQLPTCFLLGLDHSCPAAEPDDLLN